MKALYDFIVKVEDRYNNKVDVEGKELIVNTEISENDHIFVNRIGTVVGIPTVGDYKIKEGDQVLVNHNVFRRWNDMRGNERNCRAYLFDALYTVQPEQIYASKRGDHWTPMRGYTFVAPISEYDKWDTKTESESKGVVLLSDAFDRGAVIGYKPGMNVEFNIDNQKLYRILNKFINVEFKGKNKEADQIIRESSIGA